MGYCPNCGAEHTSEDAFCSECGAELSQQAATSPEDATEAPASSKSESPPAAQGSSLSADEGDGGITRRRLLMGGGVLVVGGGAVAYYLSSTDSPQHQIYGEGWDTSRQTSSQSATITGTLTLPSGRYGAWNLSPQVSVNLEVDFDVVSGGAIDAMALPEDEYNRYRDREQYQTYTSLAVTDTTGDTISGTVPSGDHVVIFDNTGVYGAAPSGEVDIDFTITASY